jgi:hypothetical protein
VRGRGSTERAGAGLGLGFSNTTSMGEVAVMRAARAPRGIEPLSTIGHHTAVQRQNLKELINTIIKIH